MKKTFTLVLLVSLAHMGFAQFTTTSVKIVDDLIHNTGSQKHGKASGNKVDCSGDTIEYGRFKASSITALNVSAGYRVGQFYETPGDVTISGFDFYAWVNGNQAKTSITLYCHLYEAGADSLPSGAPLRADTVVVDTTFGSGVLSGLRQSATFTPYKTNKPYIVVVSSNDTNRTSVGINSFSDNDGRGENVACGTVGGRWYHCLDLNISGAILDCDMLIEPYVSYDVFNDFTFKDCYDYQDSIFFTNTSSPFYFSRMYNRYTFFGYNRFCHRWDKGLGFFSVSEVEGGTKFTSPGNRQIRMISTLYHYRGGGTCIDTTIKTLSYQPEDVSFAGDDNICSGTQASIIALSDAATFWHRSPTDTAFQRAPDYVSKPLEKNDTVFVKAVNNDCETKFARKVVGVTTTPKVPTIKDDSICLNSLANLIAKSDAGQTRWYKDSTTLVSVHSGDVLQIGPLSKDTFFFAKSVNGACTHPGRVRVRAFVNSAFAPKEPTVSNDTTICLLHGDITLKASGSNTLRWFDVAAGGNVIKTGTDYTFSPSSKGIQTVYVDAYDGNCASSRLPIAIDVNHFPSLPNLTDKEACVGETVIFDQQGIDGGIDWFDGSTGTGKVYNGTFRILDNITTSETFYLEPYQGVCKDTVRHKWTFEAIPYGQIVSQTLDTQACDGTIPTLEVNVDVGNVTWYDSTGENPLFTGSNFVTAPFTQDRNYFYQVDNRGCATPKEMQTVLWRIMPDANFDYQVVWREVTFASKLINQGRYIWEFDDNTDTSMGTDVTHRYFIDDTYNVSLIVISPFNCIDTVTKAIAINTVGLEEIERLSLKVYPNPSNGLVQIELAPDFGVNFVEILDINGAVVYSQSMDLHQTRFTLNLVEAGLSDGVFVLRCSNETQFATRRLVLTRR